MDGQSRALAGVLAERRGFADGEPQQLAAIARDAGRDARAVLVGWRMSRYPSAELAGGYNLVAVQPRVALAEIDRHGRRWWDSLATGARPSLPDWKTGAHDLVVLTADNREVEDAALAWLDLTWADDRRLWFEEDAEHPANGKPLLTLTDDRVQVLASVAAPAWLGTVLPDAERIASELYQRTAQFTPFLAGS